jgi:hypothetical protein
MLRFFLLCGLIFIGLPRLNAQTFSSPESVTYDAARRQWLVSQNGANRIDAFRPGTGGLSTLTTGISSGPHGLEVVGDTVYACDGGRIKGFALPTGTPVFNVNLNASFLNGLTTDGRHYLFATDFSTRKIYRINLRTGAFNALTTLTRTPNGVLYDGSANRLVVVTWGSNAPIQAVSLADSTVSTLQTTTLSNCDGLTRDPAGNWYVSAWGTNALHRLAPDFSAPPVQVMSGLSNPADIAANASGDSIAIPNAGSANNVVFFTGTLTGLTAPTPDLLPLTCWPNPATTSMTLTLPTPVAGDATLVVLDATGRTVRRQALGGVTATVVPRAGLPAGFYRALVLDAGQQVRAAQLIVFLD